MRRVRRLKLILWFISGLAAAVAVARFLWGLGVTTNLSDSVPWGLWIGFDVLSGVALAAGGFVVTACVYIFKLHDFRPIVRPAILTAFLGYVAVVLGLIFDLGLPWNIWHMVIYWNPHSPLFEVGWCVMLYLTVLALEFFPVPAEEFSALARLRRALLKIRLPLVIAGIALSTLHQSSLGSLFLIMPYRLHPLWYSPLLPVLFFVSAVGLGLMMVIFESHTTGFLYYRKPELHLLDRFGAGARWVLLGYAVLRFADLAWRGELRWLARWHGPVVIFWLELALMVFVPLVLLSLRQVRRSHTGQWLAAGVGVAGVVFNRVNVGGLMHVGAVRYFPSWTELTITAGVVSVTVLAFLYIVERFRVWEQRPADPEADPLRLPEFDQVGMTWLGVPVERARTVYSLVFIVAAAVGFALLPPQPAENRGVAPSPVRRARGAQTLWIDGNLDGFGVRFAHEAHKARLGATSSCPLCHHMNLPLDQASACAECHRDMYVVSDVFRHDWHTSPQGGNLPCWECHPSGKPRNRGTSKACGACHGNMLPPGSVIQVTQYRAIGYTQALHQLCIGCHAKRASQIPQPPTTCGGCHPGVQELFPGHRRVQAVRAVAGKRIVLPPY